LPVVVTDQGWRTHNGSNLDQTSQRNHFSISVAHIDAIDVLDGRSISSLRLNLHLPCAAKQIHVVDKITSQRRLQGLKYSAERHSQNLDFVSIDIEVDGRITRKGAKLARVTPSR